MDIGEGFVNKVAQSGLITINPEEFYDAAERVVFDMKDCLFMGLILKEKDFRQFIKEHDWTVYSGKHVAIVCSADAIVPTWAYMLLTSALLPFAKSIFMGTLEELDKYLILQAINAQDWSIYQDQKVVVKGCGELPIPDAAYAEIARRLGAIAKSIMFGEPCSTVPIFKRKDS